jgi:hypothetical protein
LEVACRYDLRASAGDFQLTAIDSISCWLAFAAKPRAKFESLLAYLTLLIGEFRVVKYSIAAQHVVAARVPVLV